MKFNTPSDKQAISSNGRIDGNWYTFFNNIRNYINWNSQSGITALRPVEHVYIGLQYYDTTLNKPVYVSSINPIVWRDSQGVIV